MFLSRRNKGFVRYALRHGAALAKARAEARRQEKLAETVLPFAPSFATPSHGCVSARRGAFGFAPFARGVVAAACHAFTGLLAGFVLR